MHRQGQSKEIIQLHAKNYSRLVKDIKELFQHNQELINLQTNSRSKQPNFQPITKIQSIVNSLTNLNKHYKNNLFCSLLAETQLINIGSKSVQVSLIFKLTKSLYIFLKNSNNCKRNGMDLWTGFKYFYCYQEKLKSQLPEFKRDFQEVQRLKTFLEAQFKSQISNSISTLNEDESWISKLAVPQTWKFIFEYNQKILNLNFDRSNVRQLNQFIDRIVQIVPTNMFQQIHLNKIKEKLQRELAKFHNKKQPCCSIFFYRNEKLGFNDQKYNEYEEVRISPLTAQGEKIIRKNIISFLNTDGGIHYLGVKKEAEKLSIQGVSMSEAQRHDFLKKMLELVNQIYPDKQIYLKNPPTISATTYNLELSRFVSVEIVSLVDIENGGIDLMQVSLDKKVNKIFIVKIKVKTAPKYDTYMVKDQKAGIQSYKRNSDGNVEQVKPSQFPQLFTERSNKYFYQNYKIGNPECQNCRHDYSLSDDDQ